MSKEIKEKKKIYHKIIRIIGKTKYNRSTFMEFGWVENPTFENDIFIIMKSAHKDGSGSWELRTDEALLYIQGLSAVIRQKLTGVNLILQERKLKNKYDKKCQKKT